MTGARTPHKRWGRVIARPSEYLIKLRHGRVVKHGAGLSVFLWRGDTCTILPTSIQRVAFVADQVTAERVGVAVTGIAVYRIAEPLLAFRMLDLEDGSGLAQLGEILKDMFIGTARRLVANMTVEECVSRRKESIAAELMREIAPVVSGQGRPEDAADQGWGLVIDTIEIQDVRILSENVFAQLHAPFRAELQLRSQQAQVVCEREAHLKTVEATRAKLVADRQLEQQRGEAEELENQVSDERIRYEFVVRAWPALAVGATARRRAGQRQASGEAGACRGRLGISGRGASRRRGCRRRAACGTTRRGPCAGRDP